MPELPEVETIARCLKSHVCGKTISSVRLFPPSFLKSDNPRLLRSFHGLSVQNVDRRGKYLMINTEKDLGLVIHLKMTGQFLWLSPETDIDKHTRMTIRFRETSNELRFRDVRKFGHMHILASEASKRSFFRDLGPEPLEISESRFFSLLQARKKRIKSLLLDQSILAGIGNIYADEILHAAEIHPLMPASSLDQARMKRLYLCMRNILDQAIDSKGSSIRDYLDAEGMAGRYQEQHKVYQKERAPCHRCRTPIDRMKINGRSSFFCPRCQPPSSLPPTAAKKKHWGRSPGGHSCP